MNNAEKFKEIFKEFATEVWAFPEKDFLTWLNAEYEEPITNNDLGVDCISRADAIKAMQNKAKELKNEDTINGLCGAVAILYEMPSVTPQEPRCKDCKWWKDSDGAYWRGVGAESQCPINSREVFEGNGYCYMFEPQESEG